MKLAPGTKPLGFVLLALVAAQVASNRGCELPDNIIPTPTPKAESVLAILVEETGDREPWLGGLIAQLQNTDLGKHDFKAWDDEALPAATKAMLGPLGPLPAIYLTADGKLLSSRQVTPDDTVASIVETIKGASNAD